MALLEKHKKWIDLLQWLLILLMVGVGIVVFLGDTNLKREREVKSNETYVKIHESQSINALKKKNRELYDSLNVVSAYRPESAIQFKIKYKYKTDTIYKTEFITEYVYADNGEVEDSIYHYEKDNDTIKANIVVKAKELDWLTARWEINDKFQIINRTNGNLNETTINHSDNVEISDVTVWHRNKSWKDRLFLGPSVNAGYDPALKKFTWSIGFSGGFDLIK